MDPLNNMFPGAIQFIKILFLAKSLLINLTKLFTADFAKEYPIGAPLIDSIPQIEEIQTIFELLFFNNGIEKLIVLIVEKNYFQKHILSHNYFF